MRRKVLIVVGVLLIVCGYLGYKGFYCYLYSYENISDRNYDDFMESFEVHEDMVISKKEVDDNNYFVFKNVKIRNDFQNYQFEHSSDGSQIYCLYDEFGEAVSVFMIDIEEININYILNVDALMDRKDKEDFFKEYNINDDLDLFNYVVEKHNVNNNIFTSVRKMKYNYMTQYYTYTTLSSPSYVTKITGDYEGYLLGEVDWQNWTNVNTVNILKDDMVYKFSFWGSQFTEQYIHDIVETIVIE